MKKRRIMISLAAVCLLARILPYGLWNHPPISLGGSSSLEQRKEVIVL